MIELAKNLKRSERNKLLRALRGVYYGEGDDLFLTYLYRYPSAIVTLKTALAIYGIIDEYNNPPYDFAFQYGYRKVIDRRVRQFREEKEVLHLGTVLRKQDDVPYLIYDFERLLIEVFRKEKYLTLDVYKQTIFFYRNLVNNGQFNIPLFNQYLIKIPKANIYKEKFAKEVM